MNLFYREAGRGVPVILLHGLYGCSDNWMSIARKLALHYRVISVDLRNHGNSFHRTSHTYRDMVADIAALLDELEIEQTHLMGHSMGGKVAMAFAADYPEKTLSLTVADIAPENYLEGTFGDSQLRMNQQLLDTLLSVDLQKFKMRTAIEAEIGKTINDHFIISFIMKNLKRGTNGFEWKINLAVLKENLPIIIGGVNYSFFEERLPIFSYPVLFISGGLSEYITDSEIPIIKRIYPEAQFCTVAGATHYLHAEKPDEFFSCFYHFLKAH